MVDSPWTSKLMRILNAGVKGGIAGSKADAPELGLLSGFDAASTATQQFDENEGKQSALRQLISTPDFMGLSPTEKAYALRNPDSFLGDMFKRNTEKNKTTDERKFKEGLLDKALQSKERIASMRSQGQAQDPAMRREVSKAKASLAEIRPTVKTALREIERVEKLNPKSLGGKTGNVVMSTLSTFNKSTESSRNTTDVVNTMQSQVARILKSTFGGQLSDGERGYLNNVYGALPDMSVAERAIAMKNVKTMLRDKLTIAEEKFNELSGTSEGVDSADDFSDIQDFLE